MTLPPRPGKRNERFRDLIDLLLLEALVIDYQDLRKTCESVFRHATHIRGEFPSGELMFIENQNLSGR